jgi:hypothetical protein
MAPVWRIGAGAAIVYAVVAGVTLAGGGHPARPLFDGLTPPPPYRWVKPPPRHPLNVKPATTTSQLDFDEDGLVAAGPTTTDGQLVLSLPRKALPRRARDTALQVRMAPLDPGRLGATPSGLVPDGNAYEVRMVYRPSGTPVTELAVPGNIILTTPEPASLLLFSADGHRWTTLATQRVGGVDAVGSVFSRPGYYVAAVPGAPRQARASRNPLETVRIVLIVILSVALLINLARPVLRRPGSRSENLRALRFRHVHTSHSHDDHV